MISVIIGSDKSMKAFDIKCYLEFLVDCDGKREEARAKDWKRTRGKEEHVMSKREGEVDLEAKQRLTERDRDRQKETNKRTYEPTNTTKQSGANPKNKRRK